MVGQRRWTAEEDARIREMFAAGRKDNEIASALGRPFTSTRDRRCALGLKWHDRAAGDCRARVLAAAQHPNATLATVARAAGCCEVHASRVLREEYGAVPKELLRRDRSFGAVARKRKPTGRTQKKLLDLLRANGPMTTDALARAGEMNPANVHNVMRRLHALGQVFGEAVGRSRSEGVRWCSTAWWVENNQAAFFNRAWAWSRKARTRAEKEEIVEEFVQNMVPRVYALARSYKPFKGASFFSYMYAWAASHVRRDLETNDLPAGVKCGRYGTKTDPDAFARVKASRVTHLSHPLDVDGTDVGDTIEDTRPHHREYPPEWWERVTAGIHERDRAVILGRFRDNRTLQSVADELGVSKERARQYEVRGLQRLRDAVAAGLAPNELTEYDG